MPANPSHAVLMTKPRLRALSLAVVIVSTFFLGLGHGLGYPLTSVTFERWGAPAWVTGLAAGMPALAALVLLPFAPHRCPLGLRRSDDRRMRPRSDRLRPDAFVAKRRGLASPPLLDGPRPAVPLAAR